MWQRWFVPLVLRTISTATHKLAYAVHCPAPPSESPAAASKALHGRQTSATRLRLRHQRQHKQASSCLPNMPDGTRGHSILLPSFYLLGAARLAGCIFHPYSLCSSTAYCSVYKKKLIWGRLLILVNIWWYNSASGLPTLLWFIQGISILPSAKYKLTRVFRSHSTAGCHAFLHSRTFSSFLHREIPLNCWAWRHTFLHFWIFSSFLCREIPLNHWAGRYIFLYFRAFSSF